MAYGLRIRNAAGQIVLDTTDDTVRLGGAVYVSAGSGTASFTPSAGKSVFFKAIMSNDGDSSYTWEYSNGTISYYVNYACYIFYGEL